MSPQVPVPASPAPGPHHSRRRRSTRFRPRWGRLATPGPDGRGTSTEGPGVEGPGVEGPGVEQEASAPPLPSGSVKTAVSAALVVLAPWRPSGAEPTPPKSTRPVGPTPPPTAQKSQRNTATGWEVLVVFVISLALTVAWWHVAWEFPRGNQIGGAGDADEYSWFFSWMPFAIGHGLNPLVSTYVNFPSGINLMWNTSVLLPSFVMAPVTVLFGPAFSYNVVLSLAPALACTFSYLAFRRWSGRLPSLAGGLVLGFSPYVTSQAVGHLAQVLMASAPLFLILLDRLLVVQSAKPWREGLVLGLLAWAQLLSGEEVLAMEAVTAAIAVAVLCVLNRATVAAHFRYAWDGLKVASALFIVLAAPFLAFQYFGPDRVQNVHPRDVYVSDLLNFVVPTNITRLAPSSVLAVSRHFTGNGSEQGAYIGIP
ncbi:MAG: hypothetical protein ABSE77_14135, partial [Acidimicrobiales bacterium]